MNVAPFGASTFVNEEYHNPAGTASVIKRLSTLTDPESLHAFRSNDTESPKLYGHVVVSVFSILTSVGFSLTVTQVEAMLFSHGIVSFP